MTDTLRTRLLHVLINNTPPKYLAMPEDLITLVDALIREMGWRQEVESFSVPDSTRRRYVTDWVSDHE